MKWLTVLFWSFDDECFFQHITRCKSRLLIPFVGNCAHAADRALRLWGELNSFGQSQLVWTSGRTSPCIFLSESVLGNLQGENTAFHIHPSCQLNGRTAIWLSINKPPQLYVKYQYVTILCAPNCTPYFHWQILTKLDKIYQLWTHGRRMPSKP